MMNNQPRPVFSGSDRIKTRKGRLNMDISRTSFQSAFSMFTRAAEEFALTLNDAVHRKFAYRYLMYLQEVAHGTVSVKPNTLSGRPAFRLICNELERLFRRHFFRPEERDQRHISAAAA